jgi:hypothetical protein
MKSMIASIAFVVLSAATAMAQCQGNRLSINEELKDAGSTLVGTVEYAAPVPDSSFHLDGVNYVIHVDRVLKGKMIDHDVVTIFSENSPEKFPMQVGKQYLLFVHLNYNTYEVDNCGNSGMLQASSIENVKQLKQYAKR